MSCAHSHRQMGGLIARVKRQKVSRAKVILWEASPGVLQLSPAALL